MIFEYLEYFKQLWNFGSLGFWSNVWIFFKANLEFLVFLCLSKSNFGVWGFFGVFGAMLNEYLDAFTFEAFFLNIWNITFEYLEFYRILGTFLNF